MHLTCTEALEAIMVAEPWMSPLLTSIAIKNAFYLIAPLLQCNRIV